MSSNFSEASYCCLEAITSFVLAWAFVFSINNIIGEEYEGFQLVMFYSL